MENSRDILNKLKELTYEKNIYLIKDTLNSIHKLIKEKYLKST